MVNVIWWICLIFFLQIFTRHNKKKNSREEIIQRTTAIFSLMSSFKVKLLVPFDRKQEVVYLIKYSLDLYCMWNVSVKKI